MCLRSSRSCSRDATGSLRLDGPVGSAASGGGCAESFSSSAIGRRLQGGSCRLQVLPERVVLEPREPAAEVAEDADAGPSLGKKSGNFRSMRSESDASDAPGGGAWQPPRFPFEPVEITDEGRLGAGEMAGRQEEISHRHDREAALAKRLYLRASELHCLQERDLGGGGGLAPRESPQILSGRLDSCAGNQGGHRGNLLGAEGSIHSAPPLQPKRQATTFKAPDTNGIQERRVGAPSARPPTGVASGCTTSGLKKPSTISARRT